MGPPASIACRFPVGFAPERPLELNVGPSLAMRSFRRFAAFNLVVVALLGATFLWCFGDVYEAALLSMKPIGFVLLVSLGVVL